eukprot:3939155-Rhodomonas_salina.3
MKIRDLEVSVSIGQPITLTDVTCERPNTILVVVIVIVSVRVAVQRERVVSGLSVWCSDSGWAGIDWKKYAAVLREDMQEYMQQVGVHLLALACRRQQMLACRPVSSWGSKPA